MYRRRRTPAREPAFSFDSFLDVVTNVVGIIIRLILVAWVGARAYHMIRETAAAEAAPALAEPKASDDPVSPEIARTEIALAEARKQLLEKMAQLGDMQGKRTQTAQAVTALDDDRARVAAERRGLEKKTGSARPAPTADIALEELQRRSQSVLEKIKALEKLPSPKKSLHYHAPVSRPVHAEELMFECKAGRITFIDLAAFLDELRRGMDGKGEALQSRWSLEETVGPIGAFRLRYTIERQRGQFEGSISQPDRGSFRYGVSGWTLEAISALRGETAERALAAGSEFHRVIDGQDLNNTVITFWVYPDSFAAFRAARDYLYERGAEVAGRPLPEGQSIAASRHGSASRGQ